MTTKLIAGYAVAAWTVVVENKLVQSIILQADSLSTRVMNQFVLGVFPAEYFSILPSIISFLGNICYSIIMLAAEWERQDKSGGKAQKMTKYGYYILAAQPFAAALLTFLVAGVMKAMTAEGSWITISIRTPGDIAIGFVCGFFFTYLTRKYFLDRVFKKYVETPILGKDEGAPKTSEP